MKNKNILKWILVIGLIAAFISQNSGEEQLNTEEIKQVEIGGVVLNTEVAMTPEARTQGLSYRTELPEGSSMLFVFDKSGIYPFWMKDMNFPIDIIWIGEDMRVVHIEENVSPDSYPEQYFPAGKAKYVLETVTGFAEKNNLKTGDKIRFD